MATMAITIMTMTAATTLCDLELAGVWLRTPVDVGEGEEDKVAVTVDTVSDGAELVEDDDVDVEMGVIVETSVTVVGMEEIRVEMLV